MIPAPPASVLGQELLQRVNLGAALERPQATPDFGNELLVRSDRLRLLPSLVLGRADENGGRAAVPGDQDLLIHFHDLVRSFKLTVVPAWESNKPVHRLRRPR